MKKYKDCCVIDPNWGLIAFLLIAIVVVIYCLENALRSSLPHHNVSLLHVLVLAAVLFVFGRRYVFHKEGISICFLGIQIQRIYWYDVREVYIVQQKKLGQSDDRIYVFRNNSPYAGTDVDRMDLFSLYHPFDVLSIMLPDRKTTMCIDAIHRYYGASDAIILIKKT